MKPQSIGVVAMLAPFAAATTGTTTITSVFTTTSVATVTTTVPGCVVNTVLPAPPSCVNGYHDLYGAEWEITCGANAGGSVLEQPRLPSLGACMAACATRAECVGVWYDERNGMCLVLGGISNIRADGIYQVAKRLSADFEPCETTVVSTITNTVTSVFESTYSITPTPTPTPDPTTSSTTTSTLSPVSPPASPSSTPSSHPVSPTSTTTTSRPVIPTGPPTPPASSHTPTPSPPPSGVDTTTSSTSTTTSAGSGTTQIPDPEDPDCDEEEDDDDTTVTSTTTMHPGGIQTTTTTTHQTQPPTTSVPLTTSTVTVTEVQTLTACPSFVPDCPASEQTTFTTTKTIDIYTTICPITATETSGPGAAITTHAPAPAGQTTVSTVYQTSVHTITTCPPSVKDCPADQQTTYLSTETVPSYATVTLIPVEVPVPTHVAGGGSEPGSGSDGMIPGGAVITSSSPSQQATPTFSTSIVSGSPAPSHEDTPSETSTADESVFTGAASVLQAHFIAASLLGLAAAAFV